MEIGVLRDMSGLREMGGFGYGWLDVRRWSCDSLILNIRFIFRGKYSKATTIKNKMPNNPMCSFGCFIPNCTNATPR
jgi:hypothetical protein